MTVWHGCTHTATCTHAHMTAFSWLNSDWLSCFLVSGSMSETLQRGPSVWEENQEGKQLSVSQPNYLSVWLATCMSDWLSDHLCVCLYVCLCFCRSWGRGGRKVCSRRWESSSSSSDGSMSWGKLVIIPDEEKSRVSDDESFKLFILLGFEKQYLIFFIYFI